MSFGFQEIDGEGAGLLATCAYHPDFRINVEIMKARDKQMYFVIFICLSVIYGGHLPYVSSSVLE